MESLDNLAHWLNALTIGSSITTLVGLVGFFAACIFLAYLTRTRALTKQLALLPREARATILLRLV